MALPSNGARRWLTAGAVLVVAWLLGATTALAASSSFTIVDGAIVQVWAGNRAEVTIRTWNRPTIQLDTDDESVQVRRAPIDFGTPQNPLSVAIPLQNMKTRDPQSGAFVDTTFPPEDFPYGADFHAGPHDSVRIVAGANAHVNVQIPASVAILDARIRGVGLLTIDGYHGGTLFAGAFGGRTTLSNIATAAFVQQINGRLLVSGAAFDRLRARSNNAALVFERVHARQVEVSSQAGPIVWDGSSFEPGLARFESTFGPIAIGASGGAQLQARAGEGHVFNLWDRRTPVEAHGEGDVSATVDGGGPLVTAVSAHGNVFLYDGSLTTRRIVPLEWRRIRLTLRPSPFENADTPASTYNEPSALPPRTERLPTLERSRAGRALRVTPTTTLLRRSG